MTHAVITFALTLLFGLPFGALAVAFFIGREITQAEYRWIERYGQGQRANMPWWGGFSPRAWTYKSVLDAVLPLIVVLVFLGASR